MNKTGYSKITFLPCMKQKLVTQVFFFSWNQRLLGNPLGIEQRKHKKQLWSWRIMAIFSLYCSGVSLSYDISPAVYWRDTENVTFPIFFLTQHLYSQTFQLPFSTKYSHRINTHKFDVPFYFKILTNKQHSHVLFIFIFFGRFIFRFWWM